MIEKGLLRETEKWSLKGKTNYSDTRGFCWKSI
jgi:hypothetical protein